MGKQVYFFHSEEDTVAFLEATDMLNMSVFCNNTLYSPKDAVEIMIHQMNSFPSTSYLVSTKQFTHMQSQNISRNQGYAIEFLNSCKGNTLSRTYEAGRLYIQPTPEGEYDHNTLALYRSLCRYIKKQYRYSKKSRLYFGPNFYGKYSDGYYIGTRVGRPVCF